MCLWISHGITKKVLYIYIFKKCTLPEYLEKFLTGITRLRSLLFSLFSYVRMIEGGLNLTPHCLAIKDMMYVFCYLHNKRSKNKFNIIKHLNTCYRIKYLEYILYTANLVGGTVAWWIELSLYSKKWIWPSLFGIWMISQHRRGFPPTVQKQATWLIGDAESSTTTLYCRFRVRRVV